MKRQRKLRRPRKKSRRLSLGRKRRQLGGFLNRYDFTYAGRDTVNQAAKVAPGVIKNAGDEINNIAKERINQVITQEREEGKGGGREKQNVFFPKFLEALSKMSTRHRSDYSEILGNIS